MKSLEIVRKYAEGLARAMTDEAEFGRVSADVGRFLDLLATREDLRQALLTPFVSARKKAAVLDGVMARAGTGPKASRFLRLLLDHKRFNLLPAIVDLLPEAWSDSLGIPTFEVTSAAPLTEGQKGKLVKAVETAEKKPVRLIYRTDAALVGGLALRRGHIIYDASVEGQLAALRERLGKA